MNSKLAETLMNARFYGAKSEPIDDVTVLREAPCGPFHWLIVDVSHGGKNDLYQLVLNDDGDDVLGTPEGAAAYRAALADIAVVHGDMSVDGEPVPFTGEQSNTSVVFGDKMFKAFRHLEHGLNPDVELLSEIGQCPHVAAVHGHTSFDIDGTDVTLSMVQDLVPGAKDGWRYALSLTEDSPAFRHEAHSLGAATAAVHRELAASFPTERMSAADFAERLHEHFASLKGRAAELADVEDAVMAVYDQLAAADSAGADDATAGVELQRIHGDLHLGQVLRTENGYTLVDFEGEPARDLDDRRRPDAAARDVAGLVRSIDYAANFNNDGVATDESTKWAADATAALLDGYGFEVDDEFQALLLRALVIDKACYELVYEVNNRPDWAGIPRAAIKRLTA